MISRTTTFSGHSGNHLTAFRTGNRQQGFSLIEVLISVFVLMVGLASLLGFMGYALAVTQSSQMDLVAKQFADETMESIINARDTSQNTSNSNKTQDTWNNAQNIADGGIFVDGFRPVKTAGPDGISGTTDDVSDPNCSGANRCLVTPGKDGVLGTSDDKKLPLSFDRQIQISTEGNRGDLRRVTITLKYNVPGTSNQKSYVLSADISQYR